MSRTDGRVGAWAALIESIALAFGVVLLLVCFGFLLFMSFEEVFDKFCTLSVNENKVFLLP